MPLKANFFKVIQLHQMNRWDKKKLFRKIFSLQDSYISEIKFLSHRFEYEQKWCIRTWSTITIAKTRTTRTTTTSTITCYAVRVFIWDWNPRPILYIEWSMHCWFLDKFKIKVDTQQFQCNTKTPWRIQIKCH